MISGSAGYNGACTKDHNVALVEDNGSSFSGVGSGAQAVAIL